MGRGIIVSLIRKRERELERLSLLPESDDRDRRIVKTKKKLRVLTDQLDEFNEDGSRKVV